MRKKELPSETKVVPSPEAGVGEDACDTAGRRLALRRSASARRATGGLTLGQRETRKRFGAAGAGEQATGSGD